MPDTGELFRALRLYALGAALFACVAEGSVRVTIEVPEDARLTPLDARLASLTLVMQADGLPDRALTHTALDRSAPIELGEVPVVDGLRLSLHAISGAGRLVGFGRSDVPVMVAPYDVVEVTIPLRRPFAYVAGGNRLYAYDTTLDPGQRYEREIGIGPVQAVAALPDGRAVAVVANDTLTLVSTGTHQVEEVPAARLGSGATDLVVSDDSRWVAVRHGSTRQVSLVDLAALRAGSAEPSMMEVAGQLGAMAFGPDRLYLLLNPATSPATSGPATSGEGCGPASSLLPIEPETQSAGPTLDLGAAAADLAAEASGDLLVALPCADEVVRLTSLSETPVRESVLKLSSPTVVAVAAGRIWTMGHEDRSGTAHLVLSSVGQDGSGRSSLALAVPEERAQAQEYSFPGQSAEIRIPADKVQAYDLAVLPDGARVAVLVRAEYASEPVVEWFGEVFPSIHMTTFEVQLIDASSGTALQRLRGRCDLVWTSEQFTLLTEWACTRAAGQDEATPEYTPSALSVLYGGR